MPDVTINNPRVASLLREATRLTYKVIGKHQAQFHRVPWSKESKIGEFVTQIRRVANEKAGFPLSPEEDIYVNTFLCHPSKWADVGISKTEVGHSFEIEAILIEIGNLSNLADQMSDIATKGDSLIEKIAKLQEAA